MSRNKPEKKAQGYNFLPHNIEAEQGVLGCLLVDNRRLDDVLQILGEGDFFHPAHGRIFRAISRMVNSGAMASPVTLKNEFEADRDLMSIGGGAYLADLAGSVISVLNIVDYARTVRELAVLRAVVMASEDAAAMARNAPFGMAASEVLSAAEARLFEIAESGRRENDGPSSMSAVVGATLSRIEAVQKGSKTGLMSGLRDLDEKTTGFWDGELIVVGARPSMGKTAFALSVAHNAAAAGKSVLFFSMEMPETQLGQRLMARHTGLATGMQNRRGALQDGHFNDLVVAGQELSRMRFFVDDRSGQTTAQILSRSRQLKRTQGLDLVIIDYLDLINHSGDQKNKTDQIGEISRALKVMARDLGVPVVLLHQLNREVEKREDKRPMLADLRGSGNIEQDADSVLFLYREEYYMERSPPQKKLGESEEKYSARNNEYFERLEAVKGKAEIIIAKERKGVCAKVMARFNGVRQVFSDLDNGFDSDF